MGRKLVDNWLYYLVFLSFFGFIGVPILYTFVSFLFTDDFLQNIHQFSIKTLQLLLKSITIAALIGILATFTGSVLAFLLYKTDVKYKTFFKLVLLIPLFISPYILAVAWKDFMYLVFHNSKIIPSYFGIIIVLTIVFTPLAMLIIGSTLTNINAQIEESGLVITNFKKVLLKIIFPLIKPAMLTSFILVFIFSISEFSVPAFFGIKVFTTEIFTQFSAFYNHSLAILQSLLLIGICIALLYSERKQLADSPFLAIGNKGTTSKIYPLKKNASLFQFVLFFWLFLTVILPFFILFYQSFSNGVEPFLKAFKLLQPTFVSSIGLALISAFLIVFIGFTVAYFSQNNKKTKVIFDWLLLFSFAIPSTIFGISLIKFYNYSIFNFIYSSYAILIIAFVGKFAFIAVKLIENGLKQIPKSLDEAGKIQGIPTFSRLKNITLPLLLPAVFSTFVISFIFSLGELGTSIMIYPPGTTLMPIKVFTIMANAPQALVSSMTLIVFAISLLLISIFYFSSKPLIKPRIR